MNEGRSAKLFRIAQRRQREIAIRNAAFNFIPQRSNNESSDGGRNSQYHIDKDPIDRD